MVETSRISRNSRPSSSKRLSVAFIGRFAVEQAMLKHHQHSISQLNKLHLLPTTMASLAQRKVPGMVVLKKKWVENLGKP